MARWPDSPRDFSHRKDFPGTEGSALDVALSLLDGIQRIPAPIFGLLLFCVALLPTLPRWAVGLSLWLFFLSDWVMMAALRAAGRSYGPPQPPTLLLAVIRAVFALLPVHYSLPLQMIGTILVIYGFWFEPHRIQVARQTLTSPKLHAGPPLRVLHIGDLHLERLSIREQQLVRLVESLEPDLILFSGDFLNLSYVDDAEAMNDCRQVLARFQAPLGAFAVSGSPPVDKPAVVTRLLAGQSLRWLRNEKATVVHHGSAVDVVGVTCTHKPHVDGPHMRAALGAAGGGQTTSDRFTILLYHTPDLAPEAAEAGFDLMLSGHTHGGQVRLPLFGALLTGSLYGKRFESGRRQLGAMTLYVTRGLGMEGRGAPRVRFLCPPEITLWEITGTL
jgi:uncharacterized protein